MRQVEKDILELLQEYYHYKYMTSGLFSFLFCNHGISLADFMRWLSSRQNV